MTFKEIQSNLVYCNRLFPTKNGKKEPIVKTMKINTKCEFFTHQERNIWKKKTVYTVLNPRNMDLYLRGLFHIPTQPPPITVRILNKYLPNLPA